MCLLSTQHTAWPMCTLHYPGLKVTTSDNKGKYALCVSLNISLHLIVCVSMGECDMLCKALSED